MGLLAARCCRQCFGTRLCSRHRETRTCSLATLKTELPRGLCLRTCQRQRSLCQRTFGLTELSCNATIDVYLDTAQAGKKINLRSSPNLSLGVTMGDYRGVSQLMG